MAENIWKDAFGQLSPDREREREIWEKIVAKQKISNGKESPIWQQENEKKGFWGTRRILTAVACVAVIVIGIIFRDMIQEEIAQAWSYISRQGREQEIEKNMMDYRMSTISVYAPQIIECSEKRVIFADSTGLIIYDRKRNTVAAVVDLQEIGCNYFDGQRLETRILPQGDELFVYNVREGKPQGEGYCFDLSQCGAAKGEVLEATEQMDVTEKVQKLWQNYRKKNYCDTFDAVQSVAAEVDLNALQGAYSEYSFQWQDSTGIDNISYLVISSDSQDLERCSRSLRLYTMVKGQKQIMEEKLAIAVEQREEENTEKESLPSYDLVSDNAVEQALVDFAVRHPAEFMLGSKIGRKYEKEEKDADETDSLFVPTVRLYAEKKDGDYLKIYGQAGIASYLRIGMTLYQSSARCGLFCARMEKTGEGYQVKKIFRPGDGSSYYQDMIAFCDGDEMWCRKKVFRKYEKDENRIWSKQRRQLKEFLERNRMELQIYE